MENQPDKPWYHQSRADYAVKCYECLGIEDVRNRIRQSTSTRKDQLKRRLEMFEDQRIQALNEHEKAVKEAWERGEQLPSWVLTDYGLEQHRRHDQEETDVFIREDFQQQVLWKFIAEEIKKGGR